MDGDRSQPLHVIQGSVPSLHNVPKGCRFASRCPYADELCREKMPDLVSYQDFRKVRCWHFESLMQGGDRHHADSGTSASNLA
jgi:peptide/nickel transport system ATP-binding protein